MRGKVGTSSHEFSAEGAVYLPFQAVVSFTEAYRLNDRKCELVWAKQEETRNLAESRSVQLGSPGLPAKKFLL